MFMINNNYNLETNPKNIDSSVQFNIQDNPVDFTKHNSSIWENKLVKKTAVIMAIGTTAIGSLVIGGDYLAKRFGTEAGNAAFASMNSQAQTAITNLENTAPDIIAKKVLPDAVCTFAAEHKISQKVLKNAKLSCPNIGQDTTNKK